MRRATFGAGAPVMLLAGFLLCTRGPAAAEDRASSAQASRPAGSIWYVGDGLIAESHGRPRARLFVYNPVDEAARVTLRVYAASRPPAAATLNVPPTRVAAWDPSELDVVPRGESFWIAVEAATPILPQLVHADFAPGDPVPDALISVPPYPGPLASETTWVYPDGFVGGAETWIEDETLTILNPGEQPVTARLTYFDTGQKAVEEVRVPAGRVLSLDAGSRRPRLDEGAGKPITISGDYALRVDASAPIVTQKTRRARLKGESWVVGARGVMGFPLPDRPPRVWYYPGGYDAIAAEGGGEPWNLLFTWNLDATTAARTALVFHDARGRLKTPPVFDIPPRTSDLRWLHWMGKYVSHDPWALTLRSDEPVAAELTSAEFERRSDSCPGAMTAVNLCPEPLAGRESQWLGIAPVGAAEGGVWTQDYALFNPGGEPARVTLLFLGAKGGPRSHSLVIPPAAVARVSANVIEGLPPGEAFAVRADADQPLCAQVVVRATGGQPPYTRAIYSFVGVPLFGTGEGD